MAAGTSTRFDLRGPRSYWSKDSCLQLQKQNLLQTTLRDTYTALRITDVATGRGKHDRHGHDSRFKIFLELGRLATTTAASLRGR
jgi:hypothetical protein